MRSDGLPGASRRVGRYPEHIVFLVAHRDRLDAITVLKFPYQHLVTVAQFRSGV